MWCNNHTILHEKAGVSFKETTLGVELLEMDIYMR